MVRHFTTGMRRERPVANRDYPRPRLDSGTPTRKRTRSPELSESKRAKRARNKDPRCHSKGALGASDYNTDHARDVCATRRPVIDLDKAHRVDGKYIRSGRAVEEAVGGLTRGAKSTKPPTEVIVIESDNESGSDSDSQHARRGGVDGDGASSHAEGRGDEAYVVNQDSSSNASPRKNSAPRPVGEHVHIDEENLEYTAQLHLEAEADKERVINHPKTTEESKIQLDFGDIESTYKHLLAFNSAQAGKVQENQKESRAPATGVDVTRVDHTPRCDIECRTEGATLLTESEEDDDKLDLDFGSDGYETPSDAEENPRNQSTVMKEPKEQRHQRKKLERDDSATKEDEEFFRKEYTVGGYIVEELVRKPHLEKKKLS